MGHSLGLQHGGGDPLNYKPNFFSVMNYLYQLDGIPLLVPGKKSTTRTLCFGQYVCDDLDEQRLNETRGLSCSIDASRQVENYFSISWNWHGLGNSINTVNTEKPEPKAVVNGVEKAMGQPIDFNQDGRASVSASADINGDTFKDVLQVCSTFFKLVDIYSLYLH